LAERAANDQFEYSVATMPPTLQHRKLAYALVVVTLAAYATVPPFATIQLPRVDGFVPSITTIAFVADLVTAILLFAQFSATGSRALLLLASSYLFSSLMIIPYALTFPGAQEPGLLGAGPQSAALFIVSRRFAFALGIVGYALLIPGRLTKSSMGPSWRPAIAIWCSVAIVVIVACALTSAFTAGHDYMPRFVDGNSMSPLGAHAIGMIALIYVPALLLLWFRGKSVLDLWLLVAGSALLLENAFVALFVSSRFTFAFYATRLIPLVISKVVLIALLAEMVILHARLSFANRNLQHERENKLTNAEAVVAAIAHELRQPLAAMTLNAAAGKNFLDRVPPDTAEAKNNFYAISHAGLLASEVFENFISLFRESKKEHQSVDMNALTLEAIHLLHQQLDDNNIFAHTMLTSELPTIQGNKGQLREVILNLLQNSIEAMNTSTKQRVIHVATAHDRDSISISLQDTGPGIDPDKLASIFDTFITTKAKGTGLGLAICKMIIEQHGGKLSASSDTHYGGARFEITLPTKIAEPSVPAAATEQSPRCA